MEPSKAIQILGQIIHNQANTLEEKYPDKVDWICEYCETKKRYLVYFWDSKEYRKEGWRKYSKNKHIYGPLIAYILAKKSFENGFMIGDKYEPLNGKISKTLEVEMGIFEFIAILNYNSKLHLSKPCDSFDYDLLDNYLKHYNDSRQYVDEVNHNHLPRDHKDIRNYNFPSEISENIAKLVFRKKYGIVPNWNTKKGDLVIGNFTPIQIEVKGFMSNAPSSFGPKEGWSVIYFVDAKDHLNGNFKVFECKLSNKSPKFKNIVLSGCEFDASGHEELTYDDLKNAKAKELRQMCRDRCITQGKNRKELINSLLNNDPGSKLKKPITFGEVADSNQRGKLRGSFEKVFQSQLGEDCTLIFDGNISELNFETTVNTNLPPSRTELLAKIAEKDCEIAKLKAVRI